MLCILKAEPEATSLAARLKSARDPLTSAVAAYEAAQAIARKRACTPELAADYLEQFIRDFRHAGGPGGLG